MRYGEVKVGQYIKRQPVRFIYRVQKISVKKKRTFLRGIRSLVRVEASRPILSDIPGIGDEERIYMHGFADEEMEGWKLVEGGNLYIRMTAYDVTGKVITSRTIDEASYNTHYPLPGVFGAASIMVVVRNLEGEAEEEYRGIGTQENKSGR